MSLSPFRVDDESDLYRATIVEHCNVNNVAWTGRYPFRYWSWSGVVRKFNEFASTTLQQPGD